jgi:hypothetical protein
MQNKIFSRAHRTAPGVQILGGLLQLLLQLPIFYSPRVNDESSHSISPLIPSGSRVGPVGKRSFRMLLYRILHCFVLSCR